MITHNPINAFHNTFNTAQVHPVVSRLCAPLEGTDGGRLAECLGLDPTRFKGPSGGRSGEAHFVYHMRPFFDICIPVYRYVPIL